jgi:hypothetical protein
MEKIKGIIQAVTQPKEFLGILQIGFRLNETWFNIPGKEEDLKIMLDNYIKKGNEVEFDYERNVKRVTNVNVTKEAPKEEGNWQDDMVNFEELLNAAHEKADKDKVNLIIETSIIGTVDFDKKKAIFKATVLTVKDGKIENRFEGHGDAEGIGSEKIKEHFMRMAETRSIARALRWYTNNAKCCDVEASVDQENDKKQEK